MVGGHVAVAVGRVPAVGAGGPGQRGPQRGQQVVQGPGHDGVVVEGDVEGDDADGEADPWTKERKDDCSTDLKLKNETLVCHSPDLAETQFSSHSG